MIATINTISNNSSENKASVSIILFQIVQASIVKNNGIVISYQLKFLFTIQIRHLAGKASFSFKNTKEENENV
jgi:hypothetical protein